MIKINQGEVKLEGNAVSLLAEACMALENIAEIMYEEKELPLEDVTCLLSSTMLALQESVHKLTLDYLRDGKRDWEEKEEDNDVTNGELN